MKAQGTKGVPACTCILGAKAFDLEGLFHVLWGGNGHSKFVIWKWLDIRLMKEERQREKPNFHDFSFRDVASQYGCSMYMYDMGQARMRMPNDGGWQDLLGTQCVRQCARKKLGSIVYGRNEILRDISRYASKQDCKMIQIWIKLY